MYSLNEKILMVWQRTKNVRKRLFNNKNINDSNNDNDIFFRKYK